MVDVHSSAAPGSIFPVLRRDDDHAMATRCIQWYSPAVVGNIEEARQSRNYN